jgi:hypothetical protein
MAAFAEFQRHNPMRPVDWRWQRAEYLVGAGKHHCRHRDDEATGRAVEYIRRRRDRRRMPDIATARRLHEQGDMLATIVQARILARQTAPEIAQYVALDPAGIATYEQLFFDVRERLSAKCFVLLAASGGGSCGDTASERLATAVKLLAYVGGPLVIDVVQAVLFGATAASSGRVAGNVSEVQLDKIRLLLDLMSLPDDENPMQLLRALGDMKNSTQLSGAVAGAPFAASVEQLMADIGAEVHCTGLQEPETNPTKQTEDDTEVEEREAA